MVKLFEIIRWLNIIISNFALHLLFLSLALSLCTLSLYSKVVLTSLLSVCVSAPGVKRSEDQTDRRRKAADC